MKKIFRNNRLIAIAFFTFFSSTSSISLQANDRDSIVPVELKYVGNIQNKPLFQLSFAGDAFQNEFVINITDVYGYPLYKENIKGEVFTKKFLLNTDEIGDETIRFEISCKKSGKTVTYEVNRQTRFLQDMVINQLR
ncbi:MAG: hypothetical protein ABIT05_10930 [Chitinophagaceae bacterium]